MRDKIFASAAKVFLRKGWGFICISGWWFCCVCVCAHLQ